MDAARLLYDYARAVDSVTKRTIDDIDGDPVEIEIEERPPAKASIWDELGIESTSGTPVELSSNWRYIMNIAIDESSRREELPELDKKYERVLAELIKRIDT